MQEIVLKLLAYIAPMYFANSFAMFLGGKTRLDGNAKFLDGAPFFGQGKTIKGTFFGIAAGTIIAIVIAAFLPAATAQLSSEYVLLGFLLSIGAIAGDLSASFLKRRAGLEPGKEAPFLDQLDFIVGGIIFGSVLYTPPIWEVLVIAGITLIVHKASNYIAFKTKLKKVPW